MQTLDFLSAVLPTAGLYCLFALRGERRLQRFNTQLAAIHASAMELNADGYNTFFALSTFNDDSSRTADNALYNRSLFVDLDVGEGKYAKKSDAVAALGAFTKASGLDALGQPWLVDSGGGVHAYWPFVEHVPTNVWKPVAEAFKQRAKALGFEMDWNVSADAARVLRFPETLNYKKDLPRKALLRHVGGTFDFPTLAALFKTTALAARATSTEIAVLGPRPEWVGTPSPTAVALVQNSVTYFKDIMVKTARGNGCGQLAFYTEHAADEGMEPLWRGLLSLAKVCEDGPRAARLLSRMHPYTEERMQQKLHEIRGPYGCDKLDGENPGICSRCPHWGKITNPLALGRHVVEDVQPRHFTPNIPAALAIKRPDAPPGYFFSKAGVYRRESGPDGDPIDCMVIEKDFFLVDVLQEEAVYYSRFAVVRDADTITYVVIPNEHVGSRDAVIKTLASQNVFAAFGAGNDKHLFNYVRTAVHHASITKPTLLVPPKYGWQPNGSFAVADQVIGINNSYTFVSNKLNNLIEGMRPEGQLAEWQRVMELLCQRKMWGVVAMGAIGFGSPLMKWTGLGADAMVFHACSRESGVGKSLALVLCRSIWGSKRFSVVPKTSENTMLQRAGFLGGLPLLVDEVTSKNRVSEMEWIPNFIFDYAQGQHKLKGSGSANAELNDNMGWSGLSLLTSNSPVLEHMLGARETSSNGEAQRFLEWRTEERLQFSAAERDVLALLDKNSGVAGPVYAKWLVENQATARMVLEQTLAKWRAIINAEDAERFWVAGGACIIAGCILAGPAYANICRINPEPVIAFLRGLVLNARDVMGTNITTAEDLIDAYIREFHGQLVKVTAASKTIGLLGFGNQPDKHRTSARVAGRVEYDIRPGWVDMFLDKTILAGFCSRKNWSYIALVRQLSRTMDSKEAQRDLLADTGGAQLRVKCLRVSRPILPSETGTI